MTISGFLNPWISVILYTHKLTLAQTSRWLKDWPLIICRCLSCPVESGGAPCTAVLGHTHVDVVAAAAAAVSTNRVNTFLLDNCLSRLLSSAASSLSQVCVHDKRLFTVLAWIGMWRVHLDMHCTQKNLPACGFLAMQSSCSSYCQTWNMLLDRYPFKWGIHQAGVSFLPASQLIKSSTTMSKPQLEYFHDLQQ